MQYYSLKVIQLTTIPDLCENYITEEWARKSTGYV